MFNLFNIFTKNFSKYINSFLYFKNKHADWITRGSQFNENIHLS